MNTCVSTFMIAVNELKTLRCKNRHIIESLVRLLAPFAPFITEEIRHLLGHEESIHTAQYPTYDEKYLVEDTVTYPICINGKRKMELSLPADMSTSDIQSHIMTVDDVLKLIDNKPVKQIIIVPGRMINVVM